MSSNDSFKLKIDPSADKEFHISIDWYEENLPELGLEYISEVKKVLEIIEQNPYTFQIKKSQNLPTYSRWYWALKNCYGKVGFICSCF
jgi:hypothetical protein